MATIDIITREEKGSELEHNEVDSNFLNLKSFALDLYNNKQDLLVSGSNIKTVNGSTILGSGDINLAPISKNFKKFISIDPYALVTEVDVNLLDISSEETDIEIIGFLKFTAIVLVTDINGVRTLEPFTFDFVLEYLGGLYEGYSFFDKAFGNSMSNVYLRPDGIIQFKAFNSICAGVVVDFTAAENLKPTTIVSENVYLTPVI